MHKHFVEPVLVYAEMIYHKNHISYETNDEILHDDSKRADYANLGMW